MLALQNTELSRGEDHLEEGDLEIGKHS
jgi:hypothetical protein